MTPSLRAFLMTAIAGSFCSSAAAQSSHLTTTHPLLDNQANEVRLSVRIPFGQSGKSDTRSQPQIAFSNRRYLTDRPQLSDWRLNRPDTAETRLGFTLGDEPTLMLNDKAVVWSEDEALRLGTGGKVALGVGAAVVVGVVLVAVMIDGQTGPDNSGG